MDEQKSITIQTPKEVQQKDMGPNQKEEPVLTNAGIPLPTKSKQRKSFLKSPLFYILIILLIIFLSGYYFVYTSLTDQVANLTG